MGESTRVSIGVFTTIEAARARRAFWIHKPPAFLPSIEPIRESRLPLILADKEVGGFVEFADGAATPWLTDKLASPEHGAVIWMRETTIVEFCTLRSATSFWICLNSCRNRQRSSPAAVVGLSAGALALSGYCWPAGAASRSSLNVDFYGACRRQMAASAAAMKCCHPVLESQASFKVSRHSCMPRIMFRAIAMRLRCQAFSRILLKFRSDRLGQGIPDSALSAWNTPNLAMQTPDAAFADEVRIAVAENKLKIEAWPARRALLQKAAHEQRTAAAANLSRLTSDPRFGMVVNESCPLASK